ncbi:MAG TPA: DUF2845 domain-containing protein [Pseudomonas sabulinigri]|uniref:DUF2845 domain-containing protein n=1 Tax=marine sediment metagenome TaxID=412755 RepID=A0A0F9UJ29_9ZZZZ|nr:DUF2845 domain-containing protein [Halopseudomonas sabulinigri]HEC53591.1 DUF2845 domain-containing protein [Halopseudomonas sabulinigri]
MLLTRRFQIICLALLTLLCSMNAYALRCGTDLIDEGDLKFKVLQACGEPMSREIIGYVDREHTGDRVRVMNIEEWIYKLSNDYQSLEFEGNRLVKITLIRR